MKIKLKKTSQLGSLWQYKAAVTKTPQKKKKEYFLKGQYNIAHYTFTTSNPWHTDFFQT